MDLTIMESDINVVLEISLLPHKPVVQYNREELVTPAEHQLTLPADSHHFFYIFVQSVNTIYTKNRPGLGSIPDKPDLS